MPPLPRLRPPPFADAEERQVDAELQGVVFIPLTDEVRGPIEGMSKSLDSVAAVLLYEDSRMSSPLRSTIAS